MNVENPAIFLSTSGESPERLRKVLDACFSGPLAKLEFIEEPSAFWSAESLHLDKVSLFNSLDEEAKNRVLKTMSAGFLRESCFIEMAGLSYAGRMSLESANLDERLYYSVIASEEARHFQALKTFAGAENLSQGPDEFTRLIGDMIKRADRQEAIFLIQILLEGWGLSHYSWLATHCTQPQLREVYRGIVKDEARHHAGGLALLKRRFTCNDREMMNWLESVFEMVRVGPVRLMQALAKETDERSEKTWNEVAEQLHAKQATKERVELLIKLLRPSLEDEVFRHLDERNLFAPALLFPA